MPDPSALAAQIRALIHAQAPGLESVLRDLPDIALLAIPAGVALIVLIVLIAAFAAIAGGGRKKKAARAAAARAEDSAEEEDMPAPVQPLRASPPAAAPAPDKRAEALLEALARARAPDAEPPSAEERLAREQAAARAVKECPAAAKAIGAGEVAAGFDKLAAEAQARARDPRAAQAWRDLGIMAEGIDDKRALAALESAFAIDPADFWGDVFCARLLGKAGRGEDALKAAEAAAGHAKGPREKAIGQAEIGDANVILQRLEPARAGYQSAIEQLRMLARSGERRAQHDLSVGLSKLGDLETMAGDMSKARALFEEELTIARHLANSGAPSPAAQRNLMISLVKRAAVTNEKAHWIEARDMAEALFASGKMPAGDKPLLEGLRKQVESAG